jgi:hypothetical protein
MTQDVHKSRFYAGLYLRTKTRTRFWGWGNWEWGSPVAETVERPWAGVADWLRVAHSLAGTRSSSIVPETQANIQPNTKDQNEDWKNISVVEQPAAASPPGKRKLRFVCDGRFVGLVYR